MNAYKYPQMQLLIAIAMLPVLVLITAARLTATLLFRLFPRTRGSWHSRARRSRQADRA